MGFETTNTASAPFVCNTRILSGAVTGVQRYATEILARSKGAFELAAPKSSPNGVFGHFWEQAVLPGLTQGRVLWSPSNTGPLAVARQVVTIHDVTAFDHPDWVSRAFGAWYRFLQPRLSRRLAHIICDSQFTERRLTAHIPAAAGRTSVIPLGVSDRFSPALRNPHEAQKRFNLPSQNYLLSVCSLEPRKNLGRLIAAWAEAQKDLPADLWLILAGGLGAARVFGKYGLPELPPRTHLLGRVDDAHLPLLMASARGFVYPSLYEGFGLPPLEGMASGVPVLTSNAASIPEVTGDAALLIDPTSPKAICEGLIQLAANVTLADKLKSAGPRHSSAFTWDRTAAETLKILERVDVAGRQTHEYSCHR